MNHCFRIGHAWTDKAFRVPLQQLTLSFQYAVYIQQHPQNKTILVVSSGRSFCANIDQQGNFIRFSYVPASVTFQSLMTSTHSVLRTLSNTWQHHSTPIWSWSCKNDPGFLWQSEVCRSLWEAILGIPSELTNLKLF